MDEESAYSSTLKSIGAIVLTLALFLGVGWYVYTSLFVPPGPAQQDSVVATAPAQQAPAANTNKSPG